MWGMGVGVRSVHVCSREGTGDKQVFLEYQREESVPRRRLSGPKYFKHMYSSFNIITIVRLINFWLPFSEIFAYIISLTSQNNNSNNNNPVKVLLYIFSNGKTSIENSGQLPTITDLRSGRARIRTPTSNPEPRVFYQYVVMTMINSVNNNSCLH